MKEGWGGMRGRLMNVCFAVMAAIVLGAPAAAILLTRGHVAVDKSAPIAQLICSGPDGLLLGVDGDRRCILLFLYEDGTVKWGSASVEE